MYHCGQWNPKWSLGRAAVGSYQADVRITTACYVHADQLRGCGGCSDCVHIDSRDFLDFFGQLYLYHGMLGTFSFSASNIIPTSLVFSPLLLQLRESFQAMNSSSWPEALAPGYNQFWECEWLLTGTTEKTSTLPFLLVQLSYPQMCHVFSLHHTATMPSTVHRSNLFLMWALLQALNGTCIINVDYSYFGMVWAKSCILTFNIGLGRSVLLWSFRPNAAHRYIS